MAEPTSSNIAASERRSIAMLFLYGFGNAAAYVLARTVADSAYLSHFGPDHLPNLYMLAAGVVALSSLIYGQLAQRLQLKQLVILTLLFLGVSSLAMSPAMHRFERSMTVFAIVYLFAQVRGSLGTIQFAALVNQQFGRERPERVVGFIGAGATLAGFSMGLLLGLISDDVDIESLMYVTAGIDIVTIVPIAFLRRRYDNRDPANVSEARERSSQANRKKPLRLRDAVRTPYVGSIALVVTVSVLAATLVEYQWKATAASELHRDEEALAQYFGYFYGVIYLLTGITQLFITGRVLQRRGVLVGLLAFPSALLLATGTAWLVSAQQLLLWPLTLSKGCDTLKRSMNDPSIQVVYSPLKSSLRNQAITFVAGIVKPLAEAIAAIAIIILTPLNSTRHLSLVVIALVVVWLFLDVRLWRQFRSLRDARTSKD